MVAQLREVCAVLSGLVVASDYATGQKLLRDREFKDFDFFFKARAQRTRAEGQGGGP